MNAVWPELIGERPVTVMPTNAADLGSAVIPANAADLAPVVIPANAGIQRVANLLDSRIRGNDGTGEAV